jgi:hypothetical protein
VGIFKSKVVYGWLAVAAFIVSAVFYSSHRAAEKTTATDGHIYTWDCEIPTEKPDAITLTCGDGGMYVDEIVWETWNEYGAVGTGIYHANDCDPDCADGTFESAAVKVRLSELDFYRGKNYLRSLDIETKDGQYLPGQYSNTYTWDVMDFIEIIIM